MRHFYSTLVIILLILSSSCKNIYYSGNNLEGGITFTGSSNASLELYVDTTVLLKGTSTTTVTLGIFKSSDNVYSDAYLGGNADLEKRAAMHKALKNTQYDLIVLPKYKIETYKGLFTKSTTCYVEGYGGKYVLKNVKYVSNNSPEKINTNKKTEVLLDSLAKLNNVITNRYNNLDEIKIGDIVMYKSSNWAQRFYGVVVEIGTKNKIKVKTFPTPGQEHIIEDKYFWFEKVEL